MGAEQEALVIDVRETGTTTTLSVRGELDSYTSPSLAALAQDALARTHDIVLDLTGTTFIDSSALGALLALRRRARTAGCDVAVGGLSERVRKTMELTGVLRALAPGVPDDR